MRQVGLSNRTNSSNIKENYSFYREYRTIHRRSIELCITFVPPLYDIHIYTFCQRTTKFKN